METHRTGTSVMSGLLVIAEYFFFSRIGQFAELEQLRYESFGSFLFNALLCAVEIFFITAFVCGVIIYRCEYFGYNFDSDKEMKAEMNRTTNIGLLMAGIMYAIVLALIIF